jgi:glyoxylase-like metal-dependent hydrolase (beta-lactamase superfamily II)
MTMRATMPRQVASGVYQLGSGGVNVFFIEDDGGALWLVDTGTDPTAVREGVTFRALEPGPGLARSLAARALARAPRRGLEPVAVEHDVADGDLLPFGATAVLTPGHTAGHLALLLPRDGGVLFTGDAATNWLRLGAGPIYEDVGEGMRSLRKLAELQFETALFSHGRPLAPDAGGRFAARFGGL